MIESINKEDSEYNKTIESMKKMIENIYVNIEMRCLSNNSENLQNTEENEISDNDDSTSEQSKCNIKIDDNTSNKSVKKHNDCDLEQEYNYIIYKNVKYINVDSNIYTIKNDKIGKLYGRLTPKNKIKILHKTDKIIIEDKEPSIEELEAELDAKFCS
jgi:hypothetical protein